MSENKHTLLSAYFDAETDPTEQREAQELVASSESAQQTLQDFRSLSDLLKNAVTSQLSDSFTTSVMNAIETSEPVGESIQHSQSKPDQTRHQKSLSQVSSAPESNQSSNQATKGSSFRYLMSLVGSVAALLFIGVGLMYFYQDKPSPPFSAKVAHRAESAADQNRTAADWSKESEFHEEIVNATAPVSSESPLEFSKRSLSYETRLRDTLASNLALKEERSITQNSKSFSQENAKGSPSVVPRSAPLSIPSVNPSSPLSAIQEKQHLAELDLKNVQIGEVVPWVAKQDGLVVTLELTVVDIKQGLTELQVLLAKNDIQNGGVASSVRYLPPQNDKRARFYDTTRLKDLKQGEETETSELIAVYVETTPSQLLTTMKDLQLQKQSFSSVNLKADSITVDESLRRSRETQTEVLVQSSGQKPGNSVNKTATPSPAQVASSSLDNSTNSQVEFKASPSQRKEVASKNSQLPKSSAADQQTPQLVKDAEVPRKHPSLSAKKQSPEHLSYWGSRTNHNSTSPQSRSWYLIVPTPGLSESKKFASTLQRRPERSFDSGENGNSIGKADHTTAQSGSPIDRTRLQKQGSEKSLEPELALQQREQTVRLMILISQRGAN